MPKEPFHLPPFYWRTTRRGYLPPTARSNSFSCNTLSNKSRVVVGISQISSKKMVPPSASSNRPLFLLKQEVLWGVALFVFWLVQFGTVAF